ncbi:MAG TPA: hypothetical protein VIJ71_02340 [Mycobacteriales bacterium]
MPTQHVTLTDPVALVVLALLLVVTTLGAALATLKHRRAQIVGGTGLMILALLWLIVNGPYEGPALWVPIRGHGLTVGDLLSEPALAVGAVLLGSGVRWRPSRPSVTEAARRRAFARLS